MGLCTGRMVRARVMMMDRLSCEYLFCCYGSIRPCGYRCDRFDCCSSRIALCSALRLRQELYWTSRTPI